MCENCGNDVPFNAEVCSFCGRMFSGVKCPVCKMAGRPEIFRRGCPSCGYLSPKMDNLKKTETPVKRTKKRIDKKDSSSLYLLLGVLLIMIISVFIIFIIKGNL